MKIKLIYNKKSSDKKSIEILKEFIKLLQKKLPIENDFSIELVSNREGQMTTGSYNDSENLIKVLFNKRMLADVLRTLSHEWAHKFDYEKLKIKDKTDVGGEAENFANAVSGAITKYFIKNNEKFLKKIYENYN